MKLKSAFAAFAILALVVAALIFLRARRVSSLTLDEIPRSSLALTNGLLTRIGEATPFTGWMFETNAFGGYLSRSFLSNGVMEGPSEGFYTNGQRQVVEHFHAGVSHGPRIKWHTNGAKASEATIARGKIEGVFARWSEDGRPSEEIPMKAGQPHGVARTYFPSGFVRGEVHYADGQIVSQQTFEDGARAAPAASPVVSEKK